MYQTTPTTQQIIDLVLKPIARHCATNHGGRPVQLMTFEDGTDWYFCDECHERLLDAEYDYAT